MTDYFYSFLFLLVLIVIVVKQNAASPRWYTAKDGNKYLIEEDLKYNWLQALDACAREKLQLVVIDSSDKNVGLVQLLRETFGSSRDMWIGHHDEFNKSKDKNRPFYSASTGKKIVFGYWKNGEPNNKFGEHCVHIYRKADFKWNDEDCINKRFGYICEEHYLTAQYTRVNETLTNQNATIAIMKSSRI